MKAMLRKAFFLVVLIALSFSPTLSFSAGVEIKSLAEVEIKVKNEKGEIETKRIEASKANVGPGDVVIFTNIVTNSGKEPASDLVVTNPIPANTIYIDGSAEGDALIEFSVDGGKTFDRPERLFVTDKKGREKRARAEDYTHIRWKLKKPLGPGEKALVSFKAKIK